MLNWEKHDTFLKGQKLSSADIKRILSLKIDFSKDEQFGLFDGMVSTKAGREELSGYIQQHARYVHVPRGESLVRAKHYTNSAFVVLQGTASATLPPSKILQDEPESFYVYAFRRAMKKLRKLLGYVWKRKKERIPLPQLRGILIGKRSMIALHETCDRVEHVADIRAGTDMELLEIRWPLLNRMLRDNEKFRVYKEKTYQAHTVNLYLRSFPLFSKLSEKKTAELISKASFKQYGLEDWYKKGKYNPDGNTPLASVAEGGTNILEQGEKADQMVILWSGFARVVHKEHHGHMEVRFLRRKDFYILPQTVEEWLNDNAPESMHWPTTLQTIGQVKVVIIPTNVIVETVLPELSQAEREQFLRQIQNELTPVTEKMDAEAVFRNGVVKMLEEERYVNGQAGMVVNLDRCVRCFDCVSACASLHGGHAVFSWHGKRYQNFMISNACMHCIDPVCMTECPTSAISRTGTGKQVLINEETCIGCGACAEACPYDNIHMSPTQSSGGKKKALDHRTAVKCDLCVDEFRGPACQDACSHDALLRIDVADTDTIANWLKHKRV